MAILVKASRLGSPEWDTQERRTTRFRKSAKPQGEALHVDLATWDRSGFGLPEARKGLAPQEDFRLELRGIVGPPNSHQVFDSGCCLVDH